jgi:hypothetical protein
MPHVIRLVLGAVSVSLLGLWFALSVLNQYHAGSLIRPLQRRDALLVLPIWTFFWRVGAMDCTVSYRDRLVNGHITPWQEHPAYGTRLLLRPLWNPQRRTRYGVFDTCAQVVRLAGRLGPGERLADQPAYRALLNFVCQQPRADDSQSRQFMIVDTVDDPKSGAPNILFVSPFHDLT